MAGVFRTATEAPAPRRPASLWPWVLGAALLASLRSLIFVTHGAISFDADQAVVGLMTKHLAEGRALPLFQYALPYVLMVEVWLTVPVFWVFGASIATLKLPLLVANAGVAAGLVLALGRAGLRPWVAFVVALPIALPAPVTTAGLMDALGMTIEPFVFILLLWLVRARPIWFGVVAGIGFHVREFVAYGVAAMVLVHIVQARPLGESLRFWGLGLLAGLAVRSSVDALARYATPFGPGSWVADQGAGNVAILSGAFCFVPEQAASNLLMLGRWYLGVLWGATPLAVAEGSVQTTVVQGWTGAWPLLGLALVGTLALLARRAAALWTLRRTDAVALAVFLAAVGAQSVIVYAISRCGDLSLLTIRYALLGTLLPVGVLLAVCTVTTRRGVWAALLIPWVLVSGLNALSHAQIWREQWRTPIVSNRFQLAKALEQRGIRYGVSDYWTAYYVTFVTGERVIMSATEFSRIERYEALVARHADEAVHVSTRPCGQAPAIVPGYYLCAPGDSR